MMMADRSPTPLMLLVLLLLLPLSGCTSPTLQSQSGSAEKTPPSSVATATGAAGAGSSAIPAEHLQLYVTHCASCHGENRLGGIGPALLPVSLGRLAPEKANQIITNGSPATQMPAFKDQLTVEQMSALTKLIFQPPPVEPTWNEREIQASRQVTSGWKEWPARPVFKADPLNIFMVVESGDHHITVLDGDRLKSLLRFPTRFALHGGVKYSPDGRYAYFASRDGWISAFDIYNLKMVAEVRVGLNTRNIAVSADGRYVAAGNYLPHTLVILKAPELEPLKVIKAETVKQESSRVSAVYTAPPRESFIVALKDVPELWEISTRDDAVAPYTGLVHDFRSESGEELPRERVPFPIRRIRLESPVDDFFFDQKYDHLIGSSRGGQAWVVNLIVGRPIKQIPLSGMPHLGAGISWLYKGHRIMAAPNLQENKITILDTNSWEMLRDLPTQGPGFFLRSHEKSPYAWADVFSGPNKDLMHLIDKRTLKIAKTLKPVPGKVSGHVEFDRYGKYALLSIWEDPGELLVYDAHTLKIVKRLPMRKPSGKYNVFNKTRLSEGTSH